MAHPRRVTLLRGVRPDCDVLDMFEAWARSTPDAAAVRAGTEPISYAGLDRAANGIARRLLELGAGAERVVGVLHDRSIRLVAAQVAVLKTGSAFLPLDPAAPVERLRGMIADAGVVALITDGRGAKRLAGLNVPTLVVDDLVATEHSPLDRAPTLPDQLAYVIYTSGSTGRPKGVAGTHRGLRNLVRWRHRAMEIAPGARCALNAALAFDVSVAEIWLALSGGASIAIPDADTRLSLTALRDWIVEQELTMCWVPTSIAEGLIGMPWPAATRLRHLCTGGDRLTRRPLPELPFRLWNGYGPTECSVTALAGMVPARSDDPRPPSIGTAIDGLTAHLLDADLRPVAPGETGEIYLGGPGVARGYVGRPGLTAERFLPDPVGAEGDRLYRTGDLARRRADGHLEFIGRTDRQVKLRGYRVEPGEIENVLGGHPSVRTIAVLARQNAAGHRELVAHVVPAAGADRESLDAFARDHLPDYMVPSEILFRDTLPLTANDKVDREALGTNGIRPVSRDGTPPRTATEELVAGVWRRVLGVQTIGVHDDFFGLGGQSVLAMHAMLELEGVLGRSVPTRKLFDNPTVAAFATWLDNHRVELSAVSPIVPTTDANALPLSAAQQRLWYFDQLVPGTALYNAPISITIEGTVDAAALERAINAIVLRHEPLHSRYTDHRGDPVLLLDPGQTVRLVTEDLRGLSESARRARAAALTEVDTRAPFDLSRDPMLRALLIQLTDDRHDLVLTFHHIAFDGWSVGVLLTELGAFYSEFAAGREAAVAPLAARYTDITRWQRERDRLGLIDRQLPFWRQRLDRLPEPLELPADRPRPAERSYRGARLRRSVPAALFESLEPVAAGANASLFMVLFTAFQVLLHRYTGQDDIITGVPVAGRDRLETVPLIGFFANTLPLRVDLSGDPPFTELLARVRDDTLSAFSHSEVPLERIVEGLRLDRNPAHNPLFDVLFVMQLPAPTVCRDDVRFTLGRELGSGCAKFDLSIMIDFLAGGPALSAEYATDLFDAETVARFLEHYEELLRGAASDPTRPICRLPLLTAEEARLISAHSRGTEVTRSQDVCLHTLVEHQAASRPDALAVEFEGAGLTYAELDRWANRLAHRLRRAGVGPDVPVGLSVERSLDLPIAILGILKAGGAYVPLDPSYPTARLAAALRLVDPPILVAHSSLLADLPSGPHRVICVDLEREDIARLPADPPETGVRDDNLAYVVFTSGSTGEPKGVAMPHGPIVNLIAWQRDAGELGGPLRTLQFASASFDISCQEILTTWASGATLVLVRDDVRRDGRALLSFVDTAGIERIFLPFVALQQLATLALETGTVPARLREIITGGERLQITPQIAAFMAALPAAVLHNQYGPTETHATTSHILRGDPAAWPELPPIGRPIANVTAWILDPHGQPAPIGVPGEIYHGGACLARGYLGRPDLTADRFEPDGFAAGRRAYRTGDRARYRRDGAIEFLTRADNQVKIRGYRVEPAEIESILSRHDSVRDAAVIATESEQPGERRLVAYLTCSDTSQSTVDYRAYLGTLLPEYMIPTAFVFLDALPLTPSGKLDRRALPAPEPNGFSASIFTEPETALEKVVAAIFGLVLRVENVGRRDDFFLLGGHSLIATRMMSALRDALDVDIPLKTLFTNPSVAALAATIRAEHGDTVDTAAELFLAIMAAAAPVPGGVA